MAEEKDSKKKDDECCPNHHHKKWHGKGGGGNAVWFFGFVGAAIYFISTAGTFWIGVLGVLKAIVWPAMLVYYLLKFLGL